ncbi:MAG: hypothetical protein ACRDLB_09560, partial [Actinomycetota bacterium]
PFSDLCNHPNRALTQLLRVPPWFGHDTILSKCLGLYKNRGASFGGVSDRGHVTFLSTRSDHVAGDTNETSIGASGRGGWDYFVRDLGTELGIGGFGGTSDVPPPEDRICIEGVCIPPSAPLTFNDRLADVDETVTARGANLIGGSIASRPTLGDLYAVLELESMPRTPALAAATAGLVYGMSFDIDGKPYEVRIVSTGLGLHGETTAAFGLFDCSGELLCSKVTDLKGGFGTTGERIVFSLPLDALDLEGDSVVSDVKIFTALGSMFGGAVQTLDQAHLR